MSQRVVTVELPEEVAEHLRTGLLYPPIVSCKCGRVVEHWSDRHEAALERDALQALDEALAVRPS